MRNDKYGHAQLTGTWQKASDGDQILTTYIYDEYGRVVKQAEVGLCKNAIVKEYSYNFVGDVTSETTSYYSYNVEVEEFPLEESIMTYIQNKYDAPHTKLLTSSVITMFDYQTGYTMRDTIQHLIYDDFGRVMRNDRGGRKADMSYAYDLLHGWTTGIKSSGGFEQKFIVNCSLFISVPSVVVLCVFSIETFGRYENNPYLCRVKLIRIVLNDVYILRLSSVKSTFLSLIREVRILNIWAKAGLD